MTTINQPLLRIGCLLRVPCLHMLTLISTIAAVGGVIPSVCTGEQEIRQVQALVQGYKVSEWQGPEMTRVLFSLNCCPVKYYSCSCCGLVQYHIIRLHEPSQEQLCHPCRVLRGQSWN